ncbi:hypothetical protein NGRA_1339 [Nosema granulosis]|uniref:Uncharacterized protein n=1 Tax=Nosema granulosis TaxID=83296 RepID=A0A9P6GYL5_9MICR|nr:hypothetical protein NGRA_1339 [Nosema granulosis]
MKKIESQIKEKIKNNVDLLKDHGYLLEYAGIDIEGSCRPENCIYSYYTNCTEDFEEIELTSIAFSEKDVKIEENHVPRLDIKYRNLVYNLKIVTNHVFKQQKHLKKPHNTCSVSFFDYSKAYLKFLHCVNLNDRRCIEIFDMETFYTIFHYDYLDDNIIVLIKRLIEDPLNYSSDNKQDYIVLLIYVLVFCTQQKLKHSHLVFEKLKNCILFAKNSNCYSLKITNDLFLDKYILKLRKIELDSPFQIYEESLFLNYFFSNFITKPNLDKEVFIDFQGRLHYALKTIPREFTMSFLKNIFFKHSVLFTCVNDQQIIKTILDFYEKILQKYKTEAFLRSVYDLLVLLSLQVEDLELFRFISNESVKILRDEKFILLKLLSIDNFQQIQSLIETHKDSFNLVRQIVDLYYKLLLVINSPVFIIEKNKMEVLESILDLHIFIFKNLQSNFIMKFFNKHVKGFITILEEVYRRLMNNLEEERAFVSFNHKYWDALSKIVLQIHKFIIMIDNESKKDKKKVKSNPTNKTADLLLSTIYKIEERLSTVFVNDDIKILKSRSFEVTDIVKGKEV